MQFWNRHKKRLNTHTIVFHYHRVVLVSFLSKTSQKRFRALSGAFPLNVHGLRHKKRRNFRPPIKRRYGSTMLRLAHYNNNAPASSKSGKSAPSDVLEEDVQLREESHGCNDR